MKIPTRRYVEQAPEWPAGGRHVLAHCDEETIVVYQAYREAIGHHAIEHGVFGGDFSYSRMSWIKPNFLWMMYRSGWGTKAGQEVTLGLRIRRTFFNSLLAQAVASSVGQSDYPTIDEWQAAVSESDVRLQWDPDHDPSGAALKRRAIQLGLRGETLRAFGRRELLEVIDMTDFVSAQREYLSPTGLSLLRTPAERVYVPGDAAIVRRIKLD